jgi:hypothetical protein
VYRDGMTTTQNSETATVAAFAEFSGVPVEDLARGIDRKYGISRSDSNLSSAARLARRTPWTEWAQYPIGVLDDIVGEIWDAIEHGCYI